jgi:hypothetical protein
VEARLAVLEEGRSEQRQQLQVSKGRHGRRLATQQTTGSGGRQLTKRDRRHSAAQWHEVAGAA